MIEANAEASAPEDPRFKEYAEKCDAAFQKLFDAARAKEEVQFTMALNPEFRGMQDAGWSTAAESMQAIDEYVKLINEQPAGRMKMRIALSLYAHLSEAFGLYEIPKNGIAIPAR